MSFLKELGHRTIEAGKKVVGTKEIMENGKYFVDMGKDFVKIESGSRLQKINQIDFLTVCREHQYNAEKLHELYSNTAKKCYIHMAAIIISLCSIAYFIFTFKTFGMLVIQTLPILSFGAYFTVATLKYGLLAKQIELQQLISFKEFLKTKNKIPKKELPSNWKFKTK